MKKTLKAIGTILILLTFVCGLISLLIWDATNDAHGRQKDCEEISKAAEADSWREKSYNCLIIKDGKVIYDK